MNMKRIFLWIIAGLTVFCTAGCNNDYSGRIEELKAKADSLAAQCSRLNSSLSSVSRIIRAIDENDLITGVDEIVEGGEVVGYRINFESGSPITVRNGSNGLVPYVGTKQDSDGSIYWTICYGKNGSVDWLPDNQGNKVLAVGEIPYLDVKDNKWRYTIDGKNWVELGPSKGEDADSMFSKVVSNKDSLYVVFKLADGNELRIPKKEAYEQLLDSVELANEQIRAQRLVLEAMFDGAIYIVSLEEQFKDTVKTGVKVSLSNGSSFVIRDWVKSPVPVVLAEKDTTDNVYYWTCRYADEDFVWLTDSTGTRIRAVSGSMGEIPVVSIRKESSDGNYYWYVTSSGKGSFVTDTKGNKINVATGGAFAADALQYDFFKSVSYDGDSLELVLKDGTKVSMMRQYSVTFKAEPATAYNSTTKTLTIASGKSVTLSFTATGTQIKDVVAITEGNLDVVVDNSLSKCTVTKKGSDGGSVSLIFTFAEAHSTNTRFIKLKVQ